MYAVIFKARVGEQGGDYPQMARQLRDKALRDYHCLEFISASENGQEIAISYWQSLDDIRAWKADPLHRQAQQLGQAGWYRDYEVEVVELLRRYGNR